jgi:hypothetical protein
VSERKRRRLACQLAVVGELNSLEELSLKLPFTSPVVNSRVTAILILFIQNIIEFTFTKQ